MRCALNLTRYYRDVNGKLKTEDPNVAQDIAAWGEDGLCQPKTCYGAGFFLSSVCVLLSAFRVR